MREKIFNIQTHLVRRLSAQGFAVGITSDDAFHNVIAWQLFYFSSIIDCRVDCVLTVNKTPRPAANYRQSQAVCLRLVCPHMANWVEPGEETLFRGYLQHREALTQFEGLVVKSAEWSGNDEDRQSGDQLSGSVWGLVSWDGQGGQTGVEAKGAYHNDWWNSLEIRKGDALEAQGEKGKAREHEETSRKRFSFHWIKLPHLLSYPDPENAYPLLSWRIFKYL